MTDRQPITADHMKALADSRLENPTLVRHSDGRLEVISIPTPTYRIILGQEDLDSRDLAGCSVREQAATANELEAHLIELDVHR